MPDHSEPVAAPVNHPPSLAVPAPVTSGEGQRTPRPLVLLTIAFMIGLILTDLFHFSTATLSILSVFFIIILIYLKLIKKYPFLSTYFIVILCLLTGGLRLKVFHHQPAEHLKNFKAEKVAVRVTGIVISEVEEKSYPDKIGISPMADHVSKNYSVQSASFLLQTEQLAAQNISTTVCGLLKVNTYNNFIPDVTYGDKVELLGRIYSPAEPTNPGQFDYRRYLQQQGIHKILSLGKPEDIKIIKKESGNFILAAIFKSRKYLSGQFNQSFNRPEHSAFLNALVLGIRETMPEELENKFIRTGTVHILAVSGLNVAIVISVFLFTLWLFGIRGRAKSIVLILVIIFYAGLTGFNIPVVRASVMALTFVGAELFKRKSNMLNNLALAALVILLWNPNDVFNTGFQLSFLAVLAIVIFTGPFRRIFPEENQALMSLVPQNLWEKYWRWLKLYGYNAFAVSGAAWFGVAPLVLLYFNIITPITLLANVLVAPLIFLIFSAGLFILPFLCLGISFPFIEITSVLIRLLELTLTLNLKIPAGYFFLPDIPVWLVLLYYAFLAIWI
ncbi:MAG: ComEC/Rec2 family competence protein, partial [Planctomycetota bacterium]